MKRRKLEITLQNLRGFTHPKANLEQYLTPASVAADILMLAYSMGDIDGKEAADFGAGPGIFTIGTCLLGAKKIYAVEIDGDAIADLKSNIARINCKNVEIINESVDVFDENVDTVFQNAPFGAQSPHADIPFLKKALKVGNVVYTLHNGNTTDFLKRKICELGGRITHTAEFEFIIPNTYKFHRKEGVSRKFVFFRVETVKDNLK